MREALQAEGTLAINLCQRLGLPALLCHSSGRPDPAPGTRDREGSRASSGAQDTQPGHHTRVWLLARRLACSLQDRGWQALNTVTPATPLTGQPVTS